MEYGPENNIFVQKMMVKSGLEKIFLKFLHAYFMKVHKITYSVIKITIFLHGGISKLFFLDHFSPSFLDQNGIFGYRFHFEGKTDV